MSLLFVWLTRQDLSVLFLTLMVIFAMVLGGGGSPAPLIEMALQIAMAVLVVLWFWVVPRATLTAGAPLAWVLAGLVLVIPIVQLLPLPPSLWHALPGRGDEQAALDLVGLGNSWRPLSMAPYRTLASLLAMVPAALLIPLTALQTVRARVTMLIAVAVVATLSLVVGAGQLLGGMWTTLRPYTPDSWWLDGFQANHNAQADVLLIAMMGAAAVLAELTGRGFIPRLYHLLGLLAANILAFVFGVVLTSSRAGILLLPLALILQGVLLRPWLAPSRRVVIISLSMVIGGAVLVANSEVLRGVVQRFYVADPMRPMIWRGTWYALVLHWPWGTGMGTFQRIYEATEALESISEWSINRAHNDYLEFALEAGLLGMVVLLMLVIVLVWAISRPARPEHERSRVLSFYAKGGLAILALHSLVDYPLRSMSLACLAGVLVGMLFPAQAELVPDEQMKVGV